MVDEVETEAGNDVEQLSELSSGIKEVMELAAAHGSLVRGLHQVAKALDSKKAQMCFLASECSEPAYVKLVQALCKEQGIPLIEADCDSRTLGLWAGLCKYDIAGKPRRIVGATSVAILDFGQESQALQMLQSHAKKG
ncbi:bifunctional Ribosomal protein L7Ae-L30e-S12e-Gadd45/Ribosomal protein S12e/50S ribosomal protein L30e-like [Babesia duncani]|uniref:40S ribosomal protein S12 n=1 Tax=Babesia duncani TaxID=323732 RepID=A0AAD9PJG4_9APIC|nr:bifunctional Ribosomal protein L7Ae-L30e-S12e-Gadd45/Ribosomal protein S12e/50S ribosomal protein L30e-like [Babesia duncani]